MNYRTAKLQDVNNNIAKQWYVFYYYEHPETGAMVRFRSFISSKIKTKAGRRKKAAELITNINTRLRRGWNPFSDQELRLTTVIDAMEFAMKLKSATVKKRTVFTYNSVVKNFSDYLRKKKLHKMPVEDLNKQIVQDYFDNMLLNGNQSKRTYNNRLTPLKTLFYLLQKREFINYNPFTAIDKLKTEEAEITAYSINELAEIKKTLPDYNYELYVISQLIYYCFMRPAEIVRLQFKDILWDHNMIVIPGKKTKNGKSEVIIIPEHFKENMKDWNIDYSPEYFIFSRNLVPGIQEVAPTRIAEAWRRYADEFNITKHIYDFKHTGNGMAFDQGFNSRDIQLQNRHSSLDETQRYLNKFRRIASDKFREGFNGY